MFTGSFGHDLSNQRAQQYELFAKKLSPNDTFIFYANRWVSNIIMIQFLSNSLQLSNLDFGYPVFTKEINAALLLLGLILVNTG